MAQIIGLRDWDPSGTLGASPSTAQFPKPELSAMEVIGLLTNMIGKAQARKKENNQDLQWREAAKAELGISLPLGMGKLYPEMVQKKFEASISPKEWKPTTKEEAIEVERKKNKIKSEGQYTPEQIQQMFGGNVPPGTTMKIGNMTVPLNPKLTSEQGASVAAAVEVRDDVDSFKTLLTKHAGEAGVIAKLTLPYALVGGETEEMKRITDQLRARIPFAKGGKQLTPFEAKTLFTLLPQPGQEVETITKNLDKFVNEFFRMSEIATKGTAGVTGDILQDRQAQKVLNPDIQSKVQKAKAAGYSDEEIQAYLSGGK